MNNISSMHCTRKGCKDVFHAFLVKNATYDSPLEIPCLKAETRTPKRLIAFSKAVHSTETDAWVHFYEDDIAFERLWNRPKTYLPILKKFKGVISPDFSVYRDMPLVMQQWNIYRSRALAHWLQENGVPVIPNIRFSDDRTFELACAGISRHAVIAIGSHGCIRLPTERNYFKKGLAYVIDTLEPTAVIVYGTTPDEVFAPYKDKEIEILQFDSDCTVAHRKAVGA